MATRSLVSDSKPIETPSAWSNDMGHHDKPILQSPTTDNYEKAAAAATRADHIPATTAGSAAASVADRPGMQQRQPSWNMSDLKGQHQGQMLAEKAGRHGYTSTPN